MSSASAKISKPKKGGVAILRSIGNSRYPILFFVFLLFLFFQINQECTAKLKVNTIKRLADGTSPDLSFDGRYIAFNKQMDNCFEVFLMNLDGSNQHCITKDDVPQEIRGKHKGKATFHPGGEFLLISSENENGDHGFKTIPGIGDNHDFWVINLKGNNFTRLTKLPMDTSLQYPRFSTDGKKLIWSQRYLKEKRAIFKKGKEFGFWRIMIADFVVTSSGPRLENIKSFEPGGRGYYEPHGFSPDGSKIIFSAAITPGKTQVILDIFTFDLKTNVLTNLTNSENIHDEMALYSPSGKDIAFMSGTFIGWFPEFGYKTDLCLMDYDGKNLEKLTFFNDPGNRAYLGHNSQITKLSWHQEGTKIVFGVYLHKANDFGIYILSFDEK
ncbi:MAG: PD40 domain-containing protein [Candidatus Riflebacteria bacterium]|nr:PD40 domain-containing protein [Candidatus Riflebacteria bacterium]